MGVKLIGFEKLEAKLTKNMDLSKVKATVKKNGAQLQKTAQKEAPVDTHYLQRSITLEITDGGMTAEVESTAEYLEHYSLTQIRDQYTFLSQKNSLELNLIKMSREKSSSVLKSWVTI